MTCQHALRLALRSLLAIAFCALPFAVAQAQSTNATLSGTVTDQNGAVVPNVEISVINPATGLERTATTSDAGYFTIALLPAGAYTITARRDGFSAVRIPSVVLNVGDQKALQIQLKAGDVNATVTVDSTVEAVRTDGSVGTVINRQFVANIPLNGRSLQALIQLTPGVVLTPINPNGSATGNGQFSVNGQRTTANYYTVDGVSANTGMTVLNVPGDSGAGTTPGTTALGGTNSLVSLDALQEFRIETSTFAPEFGRTPGAQISLLTRSGTNQFHGSGSYYFRNEALDANDWFANSRSLAKPRERQNLFGGVLGGPLYLPRFGDGGPSLFSGKDRLFFFASYEGLRLQQPSVQIVKVPTTALRAQAVAAMRPLLNALPLPNGRDLGNGTAEFAASYSDPSSFNIFSFRLDGQITDKLTAFFRINHAPSESLRRVNSLSTVVKLSAVNDAYTGGMTWVAGSRLTADLRVNWTRNATQSAFDLDTFGGAVVPAASDLFLPGRDPASARFRYFGIGQFDWGGSQRDVQRQFNVVGTLAWLKGAHQLKLGGDYRRLLPLLGGLPLEQLNFAGQEQPIRNGQARFYVVSTVDPQQREAIITNLSVYAQDTWRAARRLNLTYGLRFERVPPPTEASGRLPRTLLGIENAVLQNPRLAPPGTPLFRSRFGSIAPRFGAAYQFNLKNGWESTLRGGAGIFYDLGLGFVANAFHNVYPFFAQTTTRNVSVPLPAAIRVSPVLGVDRPFFLFLLDPNVRMPYTVQWNAAWEQGLGSAQIVRFTYVGTAGRRLLVDQHYDNISLADWPGQSGILLDIQRNLSRSDYRALQVQFQRGLRRGLQVLASYTLGRSKDDASQDEASAAPDSQTGLFAREYGTSDYDVRHLLSAAVTYDVPRLSRSALLGALTNDWSLDLLVRYQSAYPVTPNGDLLFFPDGTYIAPRPDIVTGQPLYINDPTAPGGRRFNTAAFTGPAANQQGNFPRNGLRGFPASQVDLALRREFKLSERVRLQLRGELFNLFNHPNFGGVDTYYINNPNFGKPGSMLNRSLGGLNGLYQMGGPRSGQLALKLLW